MLILRGGYMALAFKIQEAADLSANDIRARLSDAIQDQHRGTGTWAYYIDHFGDGDSGHVIYSCESDVQSAPYTMDSSATSTKCSIDFATAMDVVPRTTYEVEDDGDLAESLRETIVKEQDGWYLKSSDGKKNLGGPYKKRGAAVAREKQVQYFKKHKESSTVSRETGLKLTESASTTEVIQIREAKADYEIKLIAPGKGSSAFYPSEVLKRDGPKVFTAGTHVYLNHPTAAEEAQRPEGDVANLAGVLTSTAVYHETHAKGPGLYGRMKVFADHAQMVEEKASHVGMSIRASGIAEAGRMKDGVPVLKELTGAESVDVVTRAGAGGMILTEAAKPANPNTGGAAEMDAAEVAKLVEAAVKAALAPVIAQQVPLTERALRGDAREAATKILKDVTLHESAKSMVIDTVLQNIPQKDGALDDAKFTESVNAEAKRLGAVIAASSGSGRVVGMGSAPVEIKPEEAARRAAAEKASDEDAISVFESLGLPKDAATFAAKGRAA